MKDSKTLRIISAILLAVMLASAFIGCDKPGEGGTTTEGAGTQAGDSTGDLTGIPEDLTFDGRTFRFLAAARSGDSYTEVYLDYEEDLSDPISEAVYRRNNAVQDRFDITIETEHSTNCWDIPSTISSLVYAEEH